MARPGRLKVGVAALMLPYVFSILGCNATAMRVWKNLRCRGT